MENKLKIKIQLFKQQRKITICFLVFKRTPHSPYTTKESFSLIEKVSSSHLTSRHAKAKWKFIFISKFLKHRYRDISNSPSMARPSEGCLRKWRF